MIRSNTDELGSEGQGLVGVRIHKPDLYDLSKTGRSVKEQVVSPEQQVVVDLGNHAGLRNINPAIHKADHTKGCDISFVPDAFPTVHSPMKTKYASVGRYPNAPESRPANTAVTNAIKPSECPVLLFCLCCTFIRSNKH